MIYKVHDLLKCYYECSSINIAISKSFISYSLASVCSIYKVPILFSVELIIYFLNDSIVSSVLANYLFL